LSLPLHLYIVGWVRRSGFSGFIKGISRDGAVGSSSGS